MSTRILVLDSEPVVRSVITRILEREGYVVEPIETVQKALEIVKSAPPDLMLTNVYLADMTGRDAMRVVKGICPQLPVLMVSGLPDQDVIHEWAGRDDGFDTFPKPFTPEQLLHKVRTMLAR